MKYIKYGPVGKTQLNINFMYLLLDVRKFVELKDGRTKLIHFHLLWLIQTLL